MTTETEETEPLGDLRVPIVTLQAEVKCSDGTSITGSLFVPAQTSWRPGPMRPDERLNDDAEFFPFKPSSGGSLVVLNKAHVVVASFALDQFSQDSDPPVDEFSEEPTTFTPPEKKVVIECASFKLQGVLDLDTPDYQQRILDCLNRPERFMRVRDDTYVHFVNREHVLRAHEVAGE